MPTEQTAQGVAREASQYETLPISDLGPGLADLKSMNAGWLLKTCILALIALAATKSVASPAISAKSFAIFTTSYNTHNDVVRGGVCGSLFFVGTGRAVTAHHVLNANSFKPLAGFERVRVWLLHENAKPIEIKPEYVVSKKEKDLALVRLPSELHVDARFVYETAPVGAMDEKVETDGFLANTAGPKLVRQGDDIAVAAVPRLKRLHLEGTVIRLAVMNLKARDMHLTASPAVKLSYKPVVGLSGGPVISKGKVIAMNSFADPISFQHTWGLQLKGPTAPIILP